MERFFCVLPAKIVKAVIYGSNGPENLETHAKHPTIMRKGWLPKAIEQYGTSEHRQSDTGAVINIHSMWCPNRQQRPRMNKPNLAA